VIERFLARLARSPQADTVLLEGALMLRVWGVPREIPTMDIDFLRRGIADQAVLVRFVEQCAAIEDLSDVVIFEPATISVESIRDATEYVGTRIRLQARLANVRQTVQIDFGVGDAVHPQPQIVEYPLLLAGHSLSQAIRYTFQRRQTRVPTTAPMALTAAFYDDPINLRQWSAFVRLFGVLAKRLWQMISSAWAPFAVNRRRRPMADNILPFRDPAVPAGGPERLAARRAYREVCQAIAAQIVADAFSLTCKSPGASVIGCSDALPIFVAAMRRELRKTGLF